jgi:hypothetical protein
VAAPQRVEALPCFSAAYGEVFRRHYNRESFLFAHDLRQNPLFELPELLRLSQRQPQDGSHAYWSNGKVGVDDRWDASRGARHSLPETIANIEANNSLAMLKHVERDSLFGPVIRGIMDTVVSLAGPQMRDDVIMGRGTVLIASPQRVTSYHIDSDVNFLFQIHGDKTFRVYDQNDRTLLTHEELERYYSGDPNGAVFKPHRQDDCHTYDLRAGHGVHVPCMGAHWAQNGATPSVALSINFDLRSITRLGRIYRFNGGLRRQGWAPMPPELSMWRDRLKLAALTCIDKARRIGKRQGGGSPTFNM